MNKAHKETFFAIVSILVITLGIGFTRRSFTPEILAEGDFHQVAHKGEGRAAIIRKQNGERVLRLRNFRTADKMDLYVYLISAPDALENETVKRSEIYSLGALRSAEGEQEYFLPAEINLTKYGAVVIWNRRYEVNFTTAPLKKVIDFGR